MEDERKYVKLHKFHIQANRELLEANYIKLHKIKPFLVISSYERKMEHKILSYKFHQNRNYVSNHTVILLAIYIWHK